MKKYTELIYLLREVRLVGNNTITDPVVFESFNRRLDNLEAFVEYFTESEEDSNV